jgi:uncharacterized surface protein with fasciclin (FAS1) repeats
MDHPDKPGDHGDRSPRNKNQKILKLFFPVFRNCLCPDDTGTKFNRKDLAMTLSLRALSVATILSFGALTGAALAQDNPEVGGAAMFADKNIVENAVNSADHTTLVAAVQAAGLVETLSGAGPFTVFAPVNAAFEALPAGTVDTLLLPENKDMLTQILTCHVVPAKALAADVVQMVTDGNGEAVVDTVGGCKLTLKADDGKVTVTDENGTVANVTIADVIQSNGVIHVIDAVLTPKS